MNRCTRFTPTTLYHWLATHKVKGTRVKFDYLPPEKTFLDPLRIDVTDPRLNFATLMLAVGGEPTWVFGNNGRNTGPQKVYYNPQLPNFPFIVFVVVPGTRLSSPVISPDWRFRPPDYPVTRKRVVPPPVVRPMPVDEQPIHPRWGRW